jgi:diguanylate cyclase (GGDEF)-like protein
MFMDQIKNVPLRRFFILLALVAGAEWLLMVTIDAALEAAQYPMWIRAIVDAGLLAIICVPLMFNFQIRPMQAAYYDDLTGLPNRQLFRDRLDQSIVAAKREKRNCAVVFMDLDNFKPVNDKFGHRVGDALLKRAAERIWNAVRESDTVARMGGDEFTILLPSISDPIDVERVVNKIVGEFERPFDLDGRTINIGISAGIALYPRDGDEGMKLLDAADGAMYLAKDREGSHYCFVGQ